ncbi:hypothetical protein GCM10022199_01530 [Marihabitans asiaticum]|uniref:Uncharacterized protein n=1 Tax=Marihabitans asiaticum TaxID=415218 RepID=A0A560WGB1_9MICO|nr:hypothetical protein [Marihabitans asiaticum]TWD16570.1 hypothetical protein FB557_0094 [Marihabitans asiaticum]
MSIDPGHFQLHAHLDPPLAAGTYRFTASHEMAGTGANGESLDGSDLGVADASMHVEITSPRYLLPPDQVLSTFPPAESQGAWGSRLPQIVIKRRTLPWERDVADDSTIPWLALVVFQEHEAELRTAQPVAECVTPGLTLDGAAEVSTANYLAISEAMVRTIFPTRKDVPLLAHAREVDINDTELMLGDDDGFLAVVIANRLPLPATDPSGAQVPTKYTAALINLEGQFDTLLAESPPRQLTCALATAPHLSPLTVTHATYDHVSMGTVYNPRVTAGGIKLQGANLVAPGPQAFVADAAVTASIATPASGAVANSGARGWTRSTRQTIDAMYHATVNATNVAGALLQTERRFPVLLHWSFTTTGSLTFRSLMEDLDSGLLGTMPRDPAPESAPARPPLEALETGHVGLTHRTRSGDETRAWYRGPLLPHPGDERADRLPLAHASDQLRMYVPDGREDLSLSSAFEIGRLLALNTPSTVAALLRWRQTRYIAARATTIWADLLEGVLRLDDDLTILPGDVGYLLGRHLAADIVGNPVGALGEPLQLFRPGSVPELTGDPVGILSAGFGTEFSFRGDLEAVVLDLADRPPVVIHEADIGGGTLTGLVRDTVTPVLDGALDLRVRDTLVGADQPVFGSGGVLSSSGVPTIILPDGPVPLAEAAARLRDGDPAAREAFAALVGDTSDLDHAAGASAGSTKSPTREAP